jgi:lipopolysaccharide export system protein LptA
MTANYKYSLVFLLLYSALAFAIPDSEQPVKVQADAANLDHEKGIAIYTGNVKVDQGSRHLSSDNLTIKRDKNKKIQIMIATGKPATFSSQPDPNKPKGSGKARTIKYYPQEDSVDLLDDAELTKDGDTITGPKLNYNFKTGNLKTTSSVDKRVTFILQPKREP